MTRGNNIYGKLVNNKFSDLLTTDMDTTWLQMKALLDREMPQDKEKRRLLWISWTSTGITLAVALLFSSILVYSYNNNLNTLLPSFKDRRPEHSPAKNVKTGIDRSKKQGKIIITPSF
jgi:hypothetical protein